MRSRAALRRSRVLDTRMAKSTSPTWMRSPRACAQVPQVCYVSGQANFALHVVAARMAAYDAFTREHLLKRGLELPFA